MPRLREAGSITTVNGALVTVALSDANFLPSSDSIAVDTSKAAHETGSSTCLVVGAQVKVRGTLSGTTRRAKKIEVAGCAGQKHAPAGCR